MSVVQTLQQGNCFGFILGGEHGGELSVQGKVVRRLGQCRAKQRFRLGILFLPDEQMGQSGIGFA